MENKNFNQFDLNPFTGKPVEIQGRIFFICGTTGTRKTTFIREKLSQIKLPKRIFDIDGEYLDFGSKRIDRKINSDLNFHKNSFKKNVCEVYETAIVFSEAGIFFTHHSSMDLEMREILKGARKRGNWVFFDFHSLSEIPIDMLKFCNYLVMKKTSMETKQQLSKFSIYPQIFLAYKKIMQSKNEFETIILEPRKFTVEI